MKDILSGNVLLKTLEALSNPYQMKIIGILHQERQYVSQLARTLWISRPLLYLHLQKLEEHEISESGKVMKYYELNPFSITIDAKLISEAANTLTLKNKKEKKNNRFFSPCL